MDYLLHGFVLGVSLAAPVGPIGLLCIRRSISFGWSVGFATGIGAALADMVYALIAVCGLTLLTGLLSSALPVMKVVGGTFLLYLGIRGIISAKRSSTTVAGEVDTQALSPRKSCLQTFLLTLTNPMTILSFSSALAAFNASGLNVKALSLVSGVFVGSAVWWLLLSGSVCAMRGAIPARVLTLINYASSAGICCLAVWCVLSK